MEPDHLVRDYLLLGLVPSEEDIAQTQKGLSVAPIGPARAASAVPLPGTAASDPPAAPLFGGPR